MTWTTLTGDKNVAGSIMNWVSYSKLDQVTVVDEAQSLIYQTMRVREMRDEWTFGMAVGQANQALPSRFLDPIGRIVDITNSTSYGQKIQTEVERRRAYDNSVAGAFGNNPYATVTGSSLITVTLANHGLTQDSTYTDSAGSTYPIITIVDANHFVVDAMNGDYSAPTTESPVIVGLTYTANKLIAGVPSCWGIWQERVKFDVAFESAAMLKLLYYRAPKPLSSSNPSNWLTDRYPMLMRKACQASAADFMKDDAEYEKQVKGLTALIGSTAASDDLSYRGAEFGTDTP